MLERGLGNRKAAQEAAQQALINFKRLGMRLEAEEMKSFWDDN